MEFRGDLGIRPSTRDRDGDLFLPIGQGDQRLGSLIYITVPALMVVLSLVLKARVNRIVNLVVTPVYAVTIIGSCIGEEWTYYLLGSAIEVVLLAGIVRSAWKWPVA